MMEKLKGLWNSSGKWFLVGLPLAALTICCAAWYAHSLYQTPEKLIAEPPTESEVTFDMEKNRAYTADDGIIVIEPSENEKAEEKDVEPQKLIRTANPGQVWEEAQPLSTENYTLPEEVVLEDGSMGTLVIPKLELTAPVYETDANGGEMESMTKGIAHFAITSAWEGNIGLCSHNVAPTGAVAFFRDIHKLEKGDELLYKTSKGEKTYKVTEVKEIAEDDWSYLMRYEDGLNRITMITCITGKPNSRLMVQATEG